MLHTLMSKQIDLNLVPHPGWGTIIMTERTALHEYATAVHKMTAAAVPLPKQPVSESPLALYHHVSFSNCNIV